MLSSRLVQNFEVIEVRHRRLTELLGPIDELTKSEQDSWLQEISEAHRNILQKIASNLENSRAPSVRSDRSNRSTQSRLRKSELEAQRIELEISQKAVEAVRRQEEEARLEALEANRRAEEQRIVYDRQQRELANQLQQQRLNQEVLRNQLELQGASNDVDSMSNGPAQGRASAEPPELHPPYLARPLPPTANKPVALPSRPPPPRQALPANSSTLQQPTPQTQSSVTRDIFQRLRWLASRAFDAISPKKPSELDLITSLSVEPTNASTTHRVDPVQPIVNQAELAMNPSVRSHDASHQGFIRRRQWPERAT